MRKWISTFLILDKNLVVSVSRYTDTSPKDILNVSKADAMDLRRLARAKLSSHIPMFAVLVHRNSASFFATQYQSAIAFFFGMANFRQEELSKELFPKKGHLVAVEVDFQAWKQDVVWSRALL